jgi:hypothetical protein
MPTTTRFITERMSQMIVEVDGARREIELEAVIVAGYTGRDREAVLHHIHELEQIGVPPPASVPFYWRFPSWLAMPTERVEVVGSGTSGEAEVVLLVDGDEILVTVGSDHTDRRAEAIDIGLSKAICPKPVAAKAWRAEELDGRWGDLVLRSWITENGAEVLYQEGPCSSLVAPLDLLAGIPFRRPHRFALWTGTVSAIGGVRPSARFRAELADPGRGRSIGMTYDIVSLEAADEAAGMKGH